MRILLMHLFSLCLIVMPIMMNIVIAKEIILPVRLTKDTLIPIVTLNIDGQSTELLLDTGSQTALHLPLNTLQQIPETSQQSDDVSLDLSGNINKTSKFIIKHLNINGLEFEKYQNSRT